MSVVNRIAILRSCLGIAASAGWQITLFGFLGDRTWIGILVVPICYVPAGILAYKIIIGIFRDNLSAAFIGIPAIASAVPVVALSYFYFSRTGHDLFQHTLPSILAVLICAGISTGALLISRNKIAAKSKASS